MPTKEEQEEMLEQAPVSRKTYKITLTLTVSMDEDTRAYYDSSNLHLALLETDNGVLTIIETDEDAMERW